jgi:hypothetical protein
MTNLWHYGLEGGGGGQMGGHIDVQMHEQADRLTDEHKVGQQTETHRSDLIGIRGTRLMKKRTCRHTEG